MINIAVDQGNTLIKVGKFNDSALEQQFSFSQMDDLKNFLQNPHDNIIVSSVTAGAKLILDESCATGKKVELTSQTLLPIQNLYATPNTLGVDRIAGACGALQLFPASNCLVIDLGTCINYEFLDSGGRYHGGIISPGVNMRFQAMHTFTARLPLVQPMDAPNFIGNSTVTCMQSGVMNGILEEIKGIIGRLGAQYPNLRVILTGGNAQSFENQLKPLIFAAPELVLIGLNRILIHNVEN